MSLNQEHEPPSALIPTYSQKRQKSVDCVRAAIALLQERKQSVTLAAIVKAAVELSAANGTGHAVSHTTILRNPDCRSLYEAAASSPKHRSARTAARRRKPTMTGKEATRAKRLYRLTKDALIELLIKHERELQIQADANAKLRDKILSISMKSC